MNSSSLPCEETCSTWSSRCHHWWRIRQATINYGNFIQTTLDFLIVAFCVFMLIKVVNKLTAKKKEEETKPAETPKAPEPSNEEKLLMEIRDLLKDKKA